MYLYQKSEYKFFLNTLDPNTANVAKNIFIIPTKDTRKKITLGRKNVVTLTKPI